MKLLFSVITCVCLATGLGISQETPPPQPVVSAPAPVPVTLELNPRLQALADGQATVQKSLESLRSKEKELAGMKAKDAASKPPPELISAQEQQVEELKQQYQNHEQALRALAAGVTGLEGSKPAPDNVEQEVKDVIVRPFLDMVKDLVARQREVSQVKEDMANREQLSAKYSQAINNLQASQAQAKAAKEKSLEDYLGKQRKTLETEKSSVDLQLGNLRTKLTELDSQKKSLAGYAGELFRHGILLRVGNLLLASLAFVGVMGLSRLLLRLGKGKFGLEHLTARPFVWRLVNLFYYVGSVTAATLAALLVLYASDDWFLLTLAMVVIVGIALAARNTLPKLYEQAKLLLNLGATREGERISYQGLPWLVRRMNIYCELVNPSLAGGEQRIALRNVVALASRPISLGERWFPTNVNDWILLPDGTPANVVHQTPEFVQLRLNGGATQVFRTLDFLALNARNLTPGFRLMSKLEIDFKHAPDVNSIAETLRKAVELGLQPFIAVGTLKQLVVELSNIGSSSLDVIVQSDFTGDCAPRYFELRREIQQLALAAATLNGWIIPYPQLVLHQAR